MGRLTGPPTDNQSVAFSMKVNSKHDLKKRDKGIRGKVRKSISKKQKRRETLMDLRDSNDIDIGCDVYTITHGCVYL